MGDDTPEVGDEGHEERVQSKCVCVCVWGGGCPMLYIEGPEGPGVSERSWKAENTLGDPIKERQKG